MTERQAAIERGARIHAIDRRGEGYFGIDALGRLQARLDPDGPIRIPLPELGPPKA